MTIKAVLSVPLMTDKAATVPLLTGAQSPSTDATCQRVSPGSDAEPAGAATGAQPGPSPAKEAGPTAREMSGWAMAGSAAA